MPLVGTPSAEWCRKRSFPHKGDLGLLSNSRRSLRLVPYLHSSSNLQHQTNSSPSLTNCGDCQSPTDRKINKTKGEVKTRFLWKDRKWNRAKVTRIFLTIEKWTRDHVFTWSLCGGNFSCCISLCLESKQVVNSKSRIAAIKHTYSFHHEMVFLTKSLYLGNWRGLTRQMS
jgi:hypothetical protein